MECHKRGPQNALAVWASVRPLPLGEARDGKGSEGATSRSVAACPGVIFGKGPSGSGRVTNLRSQAETCEGLPLSTLGRLVGALNGWWAFGRCVSADVVRVWGRAEAMSELMFWPAKKSLHLVFEFYAF